MNTPNDGGPAFPVPCIQTRDGQIVSQRQYFDEGGMTLLEYYAGQVLPDVYESNRACGNRSKVAKDAFDMAAEMVAEAQRRKEAAK